MLTTRHRTLAACAAGALLLTALAGCGSSDKTKNADASTTTSSSTTPTPTPSSTPTGDAAAASDGPPAAPGERLTKDNLVATMLAAMRDKKTAHMSMEIGSSISADADVRYGDSGTDMKMTMDMGPTKAAVIMVNRVMYMQQSAGGKFVKIDPSDPALGGLMDQMSSFGPESSVAAMRGAVQKVEYAGTSTVAGQKVDKYHVTVDSSAIAKTLGSSAGAANLPSTLTYVLYVDSNHLMRRIDMTVAKQAIKMTVTDWGKPVDIAAPPASQLLSQ
jgi:LppX_LprAFG lipoprotein